MKLRTQITLTIFISILLTVVAIGSVIYYSQKKYVEGTLSRCLEYIGQTTTAQMDSFLLERGKEMVLVSGSSTLRGDAEQATYGLDRYRRTFSDYSAFVLADPQGNLIAKSGDILLTKGEDSVTAALKRWYGPARQGVKVIDIIPDPGVFAHYIVYILPVPQPEGEVRWLYGQINSEKIASLAIDVRVGETGRATLFNKDGLLIGHENKKRYGYDMSKYPIMEAPVRQNRGNPGDFFVSGDGREKWGMTMLLEHTQREYGLKWGVIVDQTVSELYAPLTNLRWTIVIGTIVGVTLFSLLGALISGRLTQSVNVTAAFARQVAQGNLDERLNIHQKNEIGVLADALRTMVDNLKSKINEAEARSSEAVEQSSRAQEAMTEARNQEEQVKGLLETMKEVAHQSNRISDLVFSASEQLAHRVEQATQGAEQQRERVGETVTAMEEMNATVLEVARNASGAADGAESAKDNAAQGAGMVRELVQSIRQVQSRALHLKENMSVLGDKAEQIGQVMDVIEDIADQTNLLALNAAIEAARAGDAGRGFAVVADEVRKLAEKTMKATHEVGQAIDAIQGDTRKNIQGMDEAAKAVEEATALAERSGEALGRIVDLVLASADKVRSIATAAEQQSLASEEINRGLAEINRIAEETAEIMEQSSGAVTELAGQAKSLRALIRQLQA